MPEQRILRDVLKHLHWDAGLTNWLTFKGEMSTAFRKYWCNDGHHHSVDEDTTGISSEEEDVKAIIVPVVSLGVREWIKLVPFMHSAPKIRGLGKMHWQKQHYDLVWLPRA